MRLPGNSATAAPTTIWPVNRPRNRGASRKVRETDRSTPRGFREGVGGRQGYDRGGHCAGAQQADAEQQLGVVAGDRLERLGGLGGRAERAGVPDGGAGGDDDEERHRAGEDRAGDGVHALQRVLLGGDAFVGDGSCLVELHVGGDGGAMIATPSSRKALVASRWGTRVLAATWPQLGWARNAAMG